MTRLTRKQVVDQSFLEMRAHLLEVAATLDRYDRAQFDADALEDNRWAKIRQAIEILSQSQSEPNRTEKLLMLFSDLTSVAQ